MGNYIYYSLVFSGIVIFSDLSYRSEKQQKNYYQKITSAYAMDWDKSTGLLVGLISGPSSVVGRAYRGISPGPQTSSSPKPIAFYTQGAQQKTRRVLEF